MLKNGPSNEEKKEFLAREEVRTMEKDIAKLQESKSKEERERVASLKTDEKQKVPQDATAMPAAPQSHQPQKEKISLRKTGSFEKILIRGAIIFFLVLLGGFFFWFFEIREKNENKTVPILPMTPSAEESKGLDFENLGQLFLVGFEGKNLTPELEDFFKKYKPGGILLLQKNIESPEQLKKLVSDLQILSLKETGFPLFVAVDQEGDPMSRIGFLKEKTGQAQTANTENAFAIGKKRGQELKELGINLNLAPVLDLMSPSDFYYNRTFQKSAQLSGQLAKFMIWGQKEAKILTALKHFPGYVGISFNPEGKLAQIEKTPEISQFKIAMEANPEFLMLANAVYKDIDPSLPFTFSPKAMEFLKNSLAGKTPLIISDDLAQNSLLEKFSLREIVSRPLTHGVDILIFSGWQADVKKGMEELEKAVLEGQIPQKRIQEAIGKVVQLKNKILK